MHNSHLISVIMPCFNSEMFLADSITSALSQSHQDIELIIVNDGSTDNSLSIIKKLTDPRLVIINQANSGVCKARNEALKVAKGEFIAFLDADDTWDSKHLSKLLQVLTDQPEAVLAYCGWQNIGLTGRRGEPYIPGDIEQADKVELLLAHCPWPIHACLTYRWAIEEAGCFDPRYITGEDYLLWLKIASQHPVRRLPEVLAYYHFHDEPQATSDSTRLAINTVQVKHAFIEEHRNKTRGITKKQLRNLIYAPLLTTAYTDYWHGNLHSARILFREVMRHGYGTPKDWLYMLPSILPTGIHKKLLQLAASPEK